MFMAYVTGMCVAMFSHFNANVNHDIASQCDRTLMRFVYSGDMKKEASDQLRRALTDVIAARKLSVLGWSRRANVPESALRNFLAGRAETLTHATLAALASAIDESVSALLGEAPLSSSDVVTIERKICDEWQEYYRLDTLDRYDLRLPEDVRFSGVRRYGAVVTDNSANLNFLPGTVVVCVDFEGLGLFPEHGDIVVCELTKMEERVGKDDEPDFRYKNIAMRYSEGRNGAKILTSITEDFTMVDSISLANADVTKSDTSDVLHYDFGEYWLQIISLIIGSYRLEGRSDRGALRK